MKKSNRCIMLSIFAVFVAFMAGFFLSRATQQTPVVQITSYTAPQTEPTAVSQDVVVFPIDINTADQTQLDALPGIGEAIAKKIIDYRRENGPFHRAEDLIGVKGIGQKKLNNILPYITIGGSSDEDTGS